MTDLIHRQAAIDALGDEPLVWYDGEDEIAERNQWRHDVAAIKALPSADVQPVRHGKWIDGKRMGYDGVFVWHRECSECGYERKDDNIDNDTLYCPNCGAKMDEVE